MVSDWPHRTDLHFTQLRYAADASGERERFRRTVQTLTDEDGQPRAVVLAELMLLADEARAELDRAAERAYLLRAYGLLYGTVVMVFAKVCRPACAAYAIIVVLCCMELVVATQPDDPYALAWLGGMLSEAGRIDDALARLEQARRMNQKTPGLQPRMLGCWCSLVSV